jgi:arylsulfatase A-like enzyme
MINGNRLCSKSTASRHSQFVRRTLDNMKLLSQTILAFFLITPFMVGHRAWANEVSASRPNVVYIMADDLGWGDISAHGGGVATPNIDKLYKQGVELTQFMGWCVCSPTRAMLLTGRHPFRVGTGPEVGGELAKEETTIAEGFKANGYRTGVFGKWHNGEDPDSPTFRTAFAEAFKDAPNKKYAPGLGANAHGFDEAWIYYGGGADFFTRRNVKGKSPVSWWHNTEFRPQDEGYTDDLVTQHAIEFIHESKERPFFCYVPFHIAHAPLQAKPNDLAKIDPKVAANLPAAKAETSVEEKHHHAAMLHALDNNVAAILAELDQRGLRDNTIVVLTSDNGAMEAGSSLPLRKAKHSVYEGGVRLPTVIHWPKGALTGGAKWPGLCGALDMFPTLMAMTRSTMPETRPLDGKNIWPALRDRQASPVDSYYWVWRDEDSLRTVDWRLHRFFDRFELYDLKADESEVTNVAETHPEVVKTLATKMDTWADSLGAALSHQPTPTKLNAKPAPEGDILAVTVTVTDKSKPSDRLIVSFASWSGRQSATDWIEFDIAFSTNMPKRRPFYSPMRNSDETAASLLFKKGIGIDQHNREQSNGPGPQDPASPWDHRVIGLCSNAPGSLSKHGVVFSGGTPGTYTVYLDNLRLRHADGSTTPIWEKGHDTRFKKSPDSPAFSNIQVQTRSTVSLQ